LGMTVFALFVFATGVAFAYWLLVAVVREGADREFAAGASGAAATLATGVLLVSWMRRRAEQRGVEAFHRSLFQAVATTEGTLPALDATQRRVPLLVFSHAVARARAALVRGELEEARRFVEEGIDYAIERGLVGASLEFVGDLTTLDALVLAAIDEPENARGRLYTTASSYSRWATAQVEVELVIALRQNRTSMALRVAEAVTEQMPLDWRVEVLVDLVRAQKGERGLGAAALDRLRRDLRNPRIRPLANLAAASLVYSSSFPPPSGP
jgi:hypothetical protein